MSNKILTAIYTDQLLEEYNENPFVSALPPIMEPKKVIANLKKLPVLNSKERFLPAEIKVHAIARLLDGFFQPLASHIQLETKISLMIRQGYKGRNPKTGQYFSRLQNCYEKVVKGEMDAWVFEEAESTANNMTLLGCSGSGKTTALNKILHTYPQAIFHEKLNITQLTYVKFHCPHDGALSDMCHSFFRAVDQALNTNYSTQFGRKRTPLGQMLSSMAHLASLHAIGIIVIDDIQNLNKAKTGGIEKMLNYLDAIANDICVPVIMVGTPYASHMFQTRLSSGRRTIAFGNIPWDRMEHDKMWKNFLKTLWKFQWVSEPGELTDELEQTMYDLTQGIIDVVVKLFCLAQHRALVTNTPNITPKLLNTVFQEEFQPVHPMLNALRSGRIEEIAEFGDLKMSDISKKLMNISEIVEDLFEYEQELPKQVSSSKSEKLVSALTQMEIEKDIAIPFAEKILLKYPDLSIPALVQKVLMQVVPQDSEPAAPKKVNKKDWGNLDSDDLRYIFAEKGKKAFYELAKQKGIIFDFQEFQKMAS